MRIFKTVLLACAIAILFHVPVNAGDDQASGCTNETDPHCIEIDQQDWAQLPVQWQKQFLKDIVDIGALEAKDRIEYIGLPQSRVIETNRGLVRRRSTSETNTSVTETAVLSMRSDFCKHFVELKDAVMEVAEKAAIEECKTEKNEEKNEACNKAAHERHDFNLKDRVKLCETLK